MSGDTESGWKWWIKTIIGGGGLTAIIVALIMRNPPGNYTNTISSTTSAPSATETQEHRSTPVTSPSPSPTNSPDMNTPPVASTGVAKVGPTPKIDSHREDNFRQVLGHARQLLSVAQYGSACRYYSQAAQATPPKFKGQVKWNLISKAEADYRDRNFLGCARAFRDAFQNIKLD